MRVDTSALVRRAELSATDCNWHVSKHFYEPSLMSEPEFLFQNHLIDLSARDRDIIRESMEEEERQKLIKR